MKVRYKRAAVNNDKNNRFFFLPREMRVAGHCSLDSGEREQER